MEAAKGQFICEGIDPSTVAAAGGECIPMEAPIAEKAARLQAILDTAVDGMVTINEQAIILSFNKAAERIFGYKANEVIGKNVKILQPSPYREHHDEYIANYLRTGIRKIIGIGREAEGLRKDGTVFPLYLAVSEVWISGRRYFTAIIRDLSQQKAIMEEMKSLARFPEENPHPILRVSKDGVLLYASASSHCLLESWGCGIGQILPEEWRQRVMEAFESNSNREIEATCGTTTYALTLVPVPDANDINIYGKNITLRKIAEDALRESEERHRALVQSSSDGILLLDNDRRILSCNQAFLNMFGFEREEVEGKSIRIIHPSDESFIAFGEKVYSFAKVEGSCRIEWDFMRKDGKIIPVEGSHSVIRDADGSIRGHVGIIRDITERKEAEKRLKEYRDHLEEMVIQRTRELEEAYKTMLREEKLRTLGTISAEMAHEIRNPLMAIGGFARRLQKRMPEVPEVEVIVKESARLDEILRRIETYLKPVELRTRECSANDVIREAVDLLSVELDREGIEVSLELAPEIARVYVDPAVLIQVIVNVVHNAAKVMRKEGKITIRTFESEQNVNISIRAPVRKKIKDPEHIFIPFGESRDEISVPICFRLLRGMGGHLSVVQEEGSVVFAAFLLKVVRGSEAGY